MPNRYSRDELIRIALDMAQVPNLQHHDAPNGVVQQDAYSIQWLQDILDFWYHMVPFSASIVEATLNCTANSDVITLPTDFILDVRNGYLVRTVDDDANSYARTHRVSLQKYINRSLVNQTSTGVLYPRYYCVVGDDANGVQQMRIAPTPSIATQGVLWYYQLPAALESHQKPRFPNDYVCIEYLKIRALEWTRAFEPGTAQKFCDKVVAGMKAAGLLNEPEDDEISFDNLTNIKSRRDWVPHAWLGQQ